MIWCYTKTMPTMKPRYTVTDTGSLKDLLDEAQGRWPEVKSRKELLMLVAEVGLKNIRAEREERRLAVEETSGALTGVYRSDEISTLRQDWPD